MPVEVVHWNPRRRLATSGPGRHIRRARRIDNFGDLLGPVIVAAMVDRLGLPASHGSSRLLTVGSILRMAHDGDTIWGTGANGKSLTVAHPYANLDVRAVRGPLTKDFLVGKGIAVPEVYGDPGLLVGHFWSREELAAGRERTDVVLVPNLHDFPSWRDRENVVDPTAPMADVLGRIAASELVVASSLHGIVVAESLGIPARLVKPSVEPAFKYEDYYRGSGRRSFVTAADPGVAVSMGGEAPIDWDPAPLLDAFPRELWS
jgi:pyruvyltransferase